MLFNEDGYNPYLPENMQMAFDSLKSKVYENFPGARTTTEGVELDFTPNNQYVRFLPKDSLEYDTLMSYENLALFNHPLDLPVEQEGEYNAEPANDVGFNWLYGVVSTEFEFPLVDYEVINDVFLPEYPNIEYDENTPGRIANDSTEIYGMLMGTELYSLYLSGHLNEEETDELLAILEGEEPSNGRVDNSAWDKFIDGLKSVGNTIGSIFITPAYAKKANPVNWCWGCIFRSGWTPNGRVQIRYDNNSKGVVTRPVRGLKVVIHAGLKSIVTYTNDNGDFSSYRKFASRVTYTAHFRNRSPRTFGTRYFRIVKGWAYFTHKHDLQRRTRNDNITYNYDLTNNSERVNNMDELAACIFVAAHDFYHGDRLGFGRPRKNMRIRIYNENDRASHNTGRYWFLANQIKMYIRDSGGNTRTAQGAITTTFHELGHASHFALDGRCFWSNNSFCDNRDDLQDEILKESWANYIEQNLGRLWFPNFDRRSRQNWTFTLLNNSAEGKYTPLFFDLVDTDDQSRNGTRADRPRDRVSRYTTAQMQNALKSTSTLQGLRDNLFNYYDNGTEEFLQELIDSYNDNLEPVD